MKKVKSRNVLAIVWCLLMILPQPCFAGDGTQWGSTPTQTYRSEVSALSQDDASQSIQSPGTDPSSGGQNLPPIPENDSPISLADDKSGEISQTLTEAESVMVLERVNELIKIASFNMAPLSASDRTSSYKNSGMVDSVFDYKIRKYEEAQLVLNAFFDENEISVGIPMKVDPSARRINAYKTLRHVSDLLDPELPTTQGVENPSPTRSQDLIRRLARQVASIIQMLRQRVEDGSLAEVRRLLVIESDPAQAQQITRPNAEQVSVKEPYPIQVRQATDPKELFHGEGIFFRKIEPLFLNEYVGGNPLLDYSGNLYSIIRFLFYGRRPIPDRAEEYLAERTKIKEIDPGAKMDDGLIRYKGKVMEMFVPFVFSTATISAPLTEDEARKGLYLLSEALVVAGNAPGLLETDAEKCAKANRTIVDFLGSRSTSAGQGRSSALVTLGEVEEILGSGPLITNTMTSSSLRRSEELIQELARHIVWAVQTAQQRVKDGSLSGARQFSATESDLTEIQQTVLPGNSFRGDEGSFQVIDSVVLGRENARTRVLLDPPHNLHPFIRLLFYGRYLTPDRAEGYLAERAKIKEICLRAKAGEGLIRYKGKVMEMFLPLPGDENGGVFELVRRM